MMDHEGYDTSEPAPHACTSCRKGKRRCDKVLPSCGLCSKSGKYCDYSESPSSTDTDEVGAMRNQIKTLGMHIQFLSAQVQGNSISSDSPATEWSPLPHSKHGVQFSNKTSFLDSEFWSTNKPTSQAACDAAPPSIMALLGGLSDIEMIKSNYFESGSVHKWMPIISRIRLDRLTIINTSTIRSDVASLLLCMKLVLDTPVVGSTGPPDLYIAIKRFISDQQINGVLTFRLLQANVLLSVYEFGQGIFPNAFMTVGQCARVGVALGIHNESAPQVMGRPKGWVDWEERHRVWWMILILDRYTAVGSDYRTLCTEDPDKTTLLPAEDGSWNSGQMIPPDGLYVSSQQSAASPFARLAQATHLLGRVIRHCHDSNLDPQFILDNFEALSQTNLSLTELLSVGCSGTPADLDAATVTCYTSLMSLYDHHSCDSFVAGAQDIDPELLIRIRHCMQYSIDMMKKLCQRIVDILHNFGQLQDSVKAEISPLALHCIYTCASTQAWLYSSTNDPQWAAGKLICENQLRFFEPRWKVAGIYLEMLRISDLDNDENGMV